jgi:DNA polymerase I-like protein with 3'-5' exonuclease and polymerase domains
MTVLWLGAVLNSGKMALSPPIRAIISSTLSKQGVLYSDIHYTSLHLKCKDLNENEPKKMPPKPVINRALKALDDEIKQLNPTLLVVNDQATLRAITGEKYALGTVRGSLYFYRSLPVIVVDNFNTIRFRRHAKWVFELDLAKVARWAIGKQKNEPAFDYRLCKTVDEVAHHTAAAKVATMVSHDKETAGGFVTCCTYTYDDKSGRLVSFVVPFFDPFAQDGAYWKDEKDEVRVRNLLADLDASDVVKAMQNGPYDCAYAVKENSPFRNYIVDTKDLMHSMWIEAPRALHNIASYFVDHYTYWKDENKGHKEDGWGADYATVRRYWRYCGLDGYYTWLTASELVSKIVRVPWALRNYDERIALNVGPLFAASLRGLKVEKTRHQKIMVEQTQKFENGKQDIRNLSGEADFNVNATNDVAWLLYDILGAKKTRIQKAGSKLGVRSTDEKVLRLMKEQMNPFLNHAIDRILAAKKPGNIVSKYGDIKELCYGPNNDRFLSWHSASATDTFRLNSGSSQFWTGTNAQNLQPFIQEIFVADPDYIFLDADYSASDDWFIAYEAEDEAKMEILRTKDTHSYHAATFFKLCYDEVVRAKKNHEDWVVHAIIGVRQIAKKFNHGKNFRMGAQMTYNLMGRDMAVATARLMGYKNPEAMTDKELIGMCQMIGDMYDHPRTGMYKRIRPWQDETVVELKHNDGNAVNAFGQTRHFFGSPDDHGTQRELSAYFGQSGTAGNVNRALRKIFYSGIDDGRNCLFVLQVHDSLKFLIHKSALHLIPKIKAIMEEPLTLKGRTFFVPTALEVGLTDGKRMMPWREDITYEEVVAHEKKTYEKKFPKGAAGLLQQLSNLNFGSIGKSLDEELDLNFEDQDGLDQQDGVLEDVEE